MNFKEIIEAALKEEGGISQSYDPVWRTGIWKWKGTELFVYFIGGGCEIHKCRNPVLDGYLFDMDPEDLLDPNWSSATLAKQIDDGIVRLKNDL